MSEIEVEKLVSWAEDHGAVIDSSIRFGKRKACVSGYSTKTITEEPTTPQIKIPLDLILRKEVADSHFGEDTFNLADNVNSSIKLLVAKLKFGDESSVVVDGVDLKSKFAPFIDLLPVGKDTGSVFYWSADELKLLENTNLGGSLDAKLEVLFKEWYSTVKLLPVTPGVEQDLKFYSEYTILNRDELVSKLLDVESWTSFGAYLWSSIMFTSRAFPHDLIDQSCKPGQAILLPIIDLLNHDNAAKVEWKFNDDFFSLRNRDPLTEGDEVFNNYGAKGNEELLMGYGFALEKNPCDSIALKVKLPFEVVNQAKTFGFKVPKIGDYTKFAFNNDHKFNGDVPVDDITERDIDDGMLFFLNYSSLVPDNLLLLFMFLAKSSFETKPTLRSKLEALQTLRSALERKQSYLKQKVLTPEIADAQVVENAKMYRDGQKALYKASLAEIKRIEKKLLQDFKGNLTTLKKILKKDTGLQSLVESCFGVNEYEELVDEDVLDNVLFLWVILHGSSQSESDGCQAPEYIIKEYKEKQNKTFNEEIDDGLKLLANYLSTQLTDHEIQSSITPRNLLIASEVLRENSYTRVSNDEVIIVDPVEL